MWVRIFLLLQVTVGIRGFSVGLLYLTPSNVENKERTRSDQALVKQNETEILITIDTVVLNKYDYYPTLNRALEMINTHNFDVVLLFDQRCETDYMKRVLSPRHEIYCYRPASVRSDNQKVCRLTYPTNLDTKPTQYPVVEILWSILEYFDSHPTVLVHDNSTEAPITELAETMFTKGFQIISLNVDTVDDLLWFVRKTYSILDDKNRNYLVFCSKVCTNKVLNLANDFDALMNKKTAIRQLSKWLIVDNDLKMTEFTDLLLDNVAVIQMKLHEHPTDITTITQSIVGEITDTVQSINETLSSEDSDAEIKDRFIRGITADPGCVLAEIHTLLWKPGGREFNLVGQASGNSSITGENNFFPNINYGLNNKTFRVLVKEWFPFIIKEVRNNKTHFIGLSIDLLNEISLSMNFSYILVEPEDDMWGHMVNGSWTGIIKELAEHKADMSVSPLAISSPRNTVVDFSFPFYYDYSGVGYKLPDPNLSKWKKLLAPFKWEVFLCICISFILLLLLLYTIEVQNPFYKTNQIPRFGDMFLYMYGALLAQGCSNQPTSASGRCVVAFWWLFSIILVAAYSGNLIAFLTVTKEQQPFSSLNELGRQSDYHWGTVGSTIWETFLETSNRSEIKRVWDGIKEFNQTDPDVLNNDIKVHYDKINAGSYALIADKISLNFQLKNNCDWVILKESFLPMNYAITLPKDSPYYKLLFDEMMRLNEIGIIQTWERKWLKGKDICGGSNVPQVKAIQLLDIQSAFYIITIGIVIGLSCLAAEGLTTISSNRLKLK